MITPSQKNSHHAATAYGRREIIQPAGSRYFGSGSPFAHPPEARTTRSSLETRDTEPSITLGVNIR